MENGPGLKMYFLLKMGIFHCYVSLLEDNFSISISSYDPFKVKCSRVFQCCSARSFSEASTFELNSLLRTPTV